MLKLGQRFWRLRSTKLASKGSCRTSSCRPGSTILTHGPACIQRLQIASLLHLLGKPSAPQAENGAAATSQSDHDVGRAVPVAVHSTDAWVLLKELTKEDIRGNASQLVGSADARQLLREAVQVVATNPAPSESWDPSVQPPEILLGILSSDIRLGVRALRDWTNALHVPFIVPTSRVEGVSVITSLTGSLYIKYNAVSQQCYATSYSGKDRGVLVTFGGSLVGHLPLGLFDESMQQAPPPLNV